jgi:hypothetical protein
MIFTDDFKLYHPMPVGNEDATLTFAGALRCVVGQVGAGVRRSLVDNT